MAVLYDEKTVDEPGAPFKPPIVARIPYQGDGVPSVKVEYRENRPPQ